MRNYVIAKRAICIVMSLLLSVTPLLGTIQTTRALALLAETGSSQANRVTLSSLTKGDKIVFAGYSWVVLDPADGYLLMELAYGAAQPFESLASPDYPDQINFSPFAPERDTNIGYYLNNTFLHSLGAQEQALIRNYVWTTGPQGDEENEETTCKVGLISYKEYEDLNDVIPSLSERWWIRTYYAGSYGYWVVYGAAELASEEGFFNGAPGGAMHLVRPAVHLPANSLVDGGAGGEIVVGTDPTISSVHVTPSNHDAGTSQSVAVVVSTSYVPNAKSVVVSLLDEEKNELNPPLTVLGSIVDDSATLTLSIPAELAAESYYLETTVDGVDAKQYSPYTINYAAPTAVLTPESHIAGTEQGLAIASTGAAGLGDGTVISATLVDSGKTVVNSVYSSSGELALGTVVLNMTLPANLMAGDYFVKLSAPSMATAYIPYAITSAVDVNVSLNPSSCLVGNAQDVIVTVTTQEDAEGASVSACLTESDRTTLVTSVSQAEDEISDNEAVLTLSLPGTLPAGEYFVRATVSGNADPAYAAYSVAPLATYAVNLSTSPASGGTVSGGGAYDVGTSVTVQAQPRPGYYFSYWSSGGTRVSGNSTYTFISFVAQDLQLVAHFRLIPPPTPVITLPSVTTGQATDITTTGATLSGSVTYAGGASCSQVQFRYRPVGTNSWQETAVQSGSWDSGSSFSAQVSGLKSNSDYEYQALAYNTAGWASGGIRDFSLTTVLPEVLTLDPSDITTSDIVLHGSITNLEEAAISECGFLFDGQRLQATPASDGSFSYEVSGLVSDYYVAQAYAENKAGISYGVAIEFFIPSLVVNTLPAEDVDFSTATLHGSLIKGAGAVFAKGFVYGKEDGTAPLTEIKLDELIVMGGDFAWALADLELGTVYSYYAYGRGTDGEQRGEVLTFKTLDYKPVVETKPTTESEEDTPIILGGYIHFNRGFPVSQCGFLWGLEEEPNTEAPAVLETGGRSFDLPVTELPTDKLLPATTYYYRAYATNAKGTGYGEVCEFVTPATVPTVATTSVVFDQERRGMISFQGELIADGGSPITEYGFRYSTDEENWVTLFMGVEAIEEFTTVGFHSLQGLEPSTTYYVQAYAANEVGEGYGDSIIIDTPHPPSLTSLVNSSIGASTATLVGSITNPGAPEVECLEYRFQYRLIGEDTWRDTGWYNGEFTPSSFSYDLEGLEPASQYELRVQAMNSTGAIGSSPIATFWTIWGKDSDEAAFNMRSDGHAAMDIANHLRTDYDADPEACLKALYFAGFSALESAQALKDSNYNATVGLIASAYHEAGLQLNEVADLLTRIYFPSVSSQRWFLNGELLSSVVNSGYGISGVLKWIQQQDMQLYQYMQQLEGLLPNPYDLYLAYGQVAGADELARYLHNFNDSALFPMLNQLGLTPVEMVQLWVRNGWYLGDGYSYTLDLAQRLQHAGTFDAKELGMALYDALDPDPLVLYMALTEIYTERDALYFLTNEVHCSLADMARLQMGLQTPMPAQGMLQQLIDLYNPSPHELVTALYTNGWDRTGTAADAPGLDMIVLHLFYREQITDLAELMGLLKECSIDPLTIARATQGAKDLFVPSHITDDEWSRQWLPVYLAQGYGATEVASWLRSEHSIFDTMEWLNRLSFPLSDILVATRLIFEWSKHDATRFLMGENSPFHWWNEAAMAATIEEVYGAEDPIPDLLEGMVGRPESSNPQLAASYLLNLYKISDPVRAAAYMADAGFEKYSVLVGICYAYMRGEKASDLSIITSIDRDVYKESGEIRRSLLEPCFYGYIYAHEYQQTPHIYVPVLMAAAGYHVDDIVRVLSDSGPEGYGLSFEEALHFLTARSPTVLQTCIMQNSTITDLMVSLSKYYETNAVLYVAELLKEAGKSPGTVILWLGNIMQTLPLAAGTMQEAGYSDKDIIGALPADAVPAVLRELYEANTPAAMAKLMKKHLDDNWAVGEQADSLKEEFALSSADTALQLKEAGQEVSVLSDPSGGLSRWMDDIYGWLDRNTPRQRDDALAAILGSAQPGDLGLSSIWACRFLLSRGYSEAETLQWMGKNKYPIVDILYLLGTGEMDHKLQILRMAQNHGYSKDELAMGARVIIGGCVSPGHTISLLDGLGFSLQEIADYYMKLGFDLIDLPLHLLDMQRSISPKESGTIVYRALTKTAEEGYLQFDFIPRTGYMVTGGHELESNSLLDAVRAFLHGKDWKKPSYTVDAVAVTAGLYLQDQNTPWTTGAPIHLISAIHLLRETGLKVKDAVMICLDKSIVDWEVALVTLGTAGYNVGDVLDAMFSHDVYKMSLTLTLKSVFSAGFDLVAEPGLLNILKLLAQFAVIGYKMGSTALYEN